MHPSRHRSGGLIIALLASLAALLLVSGPASASVTRSAATTKALRALGVKGDKQAVRVFALRAPVAPHTAITEAGPASANAGRRLRQPAGVTLVPAAPVLRSPGEPVWLFFADRGPHQAFEHPGRIALVGARTGKVTLSRTLSWVPLVAGRLPAFFATNAGYEGTRFQVFNRRWPLRAVASSAQGIAAKATPQELAAGATPEERRTADALAAERSCALRYSDTLGDFYDFGRTDWTRARIGLFFKRLGAMNPAFVSERYTAATGRTPVGAAQRMIDARGCRDLMIYAAGGAPRNGEPGIVIGVRTRGSAGLQWQTLTASEIKRLIRANRDVTFKLVFDAPYAGRLAQRLRAERNVALLLTSGGANEPSFSYLPAVTGPDGVIVNSGNPEHLLEFTNRLIDGLGKFVASPAEVDNGIANHAADFMAWMLARANGLGSSPFGDHQVTPVDLGGGNSRRNAAPVLGGVSGTLAYSEDDPATALAPALTAADADSANLAGAAVVITGGYHNGQDVLAFADSHGITGAWHPALATLTLSGPASVASYQAALRTVTYRNTSQDPAVDLRTITIRATDGQSENPLSNAVTRAVGVAAVNDTPAVTTAAGSSAYTENGAPVTVEPGAQVSDPDSASLTGARVRIGGGFDSGSDTLYFAGQNGIAGTYDSLTGVLTLTGTATVANYQTALRSVTFSTAGDDPSTAARFISLRASDGGGDGAEAGRTVSVAAVDDAPTLTTTSSGNATYTEDGTHTPVDPALTVADPDSTSLAGATVSIGTGFEGTDRLDFTDQNGIQGSYDTATGVLTLTNAASLADYQAALRSVRFFTVGDDPGTATRTVAFAANDGTQDSAASSRGVTVTPVNDKPTVATGASHGAYTERAAAAAVDGALTVTDPDSANLQSATVKITGNFDSANDELQFVNTPSISGSYNTGTGTLTLSGTDTKGNYQSALRSVMFSATSHHPAATRTIELTVTDTDAAQSDAATQIVDVTPVYDAPHVTTTSGDAGPFAEDGSAVTIDGGVAVSDADSSQLAGATVKLTTDYDEATDTLQYTTVNGITGSFVASTGTLTLTGTNKTVAEYEQALRTVEFDSTSQNPGTSRTVEFRVDDGAGAGNLSNVATRDVAITPANDKPVVTTSGGSASFSEGGSAAVVDAGATVTDVDSPALSGATVEVDDFHSADTLDADVSGTALAKSYDSSTGMLTISGTESPATYRDVLRTVTFTTPSAAPGTSRSIGFQIDDGALSDNLSDVANRTVNLTNVNSAPSIANLDGSVAYAEDAPAVWLDDDAVVSDADSADLTGGTVTITNVQAGDELLFTQHGNVDGSYHASTGVLTISGTDTPGRYQAFLRDVRYRTNSDTPNTDPRTIELQVTDGQPTDPLSNVATKTVTVSATDDAPTVTTSPSESLFTEKQVTTTTVDPSATVSDPDHDNLQSATVEISAATYEGSQDVLDFTDTANITGSYAGGTLTLTGADTVANYQAALRAVSYRNTSDAPNQSDRVIEFSADDGAASSANPLSERTKTVHVVSVNDAPVLGPTGQQTTFTEGSTDTPSAAEAISIAPGLTASDVDTPDLHGATVQVTSGYRSPEDKLSFSSPTNGVTGVVNSAGDKVTLSGDQPVADYQAALRNVKYRNNSNTPDAGDRTITFIADDGQSQSHASNHLTWTLHVVPTDDAPVAGDKTFGGTNSAVGNTTFVGDNPDDGAPATPDPTDTSPGTSRPHKTIAADILAGAADADGPGPLTVAPGTFATNDGGTVTLQSDGDFTFEPAPGTSCTDHSDFFDYTLTDQDPGTAGTDTGRVTIAVTGCVHYVDNHDAQGNSGTAEKPFDTLAQAETASGAGDSVFVYRGDGTSSGYGTGINLKSAQKLIGEAATLTVGGDTLHSGDAAKRPTLADDNASVVALAAGNEVRGLNLDPSGTGSGIAGGAGDAGGTIDDVKITDIGTAGTNPAFELSGTSGTFNVSNLTVDNSAATSPPSTAKGVHLDTAGTVNFAAAGTISITTKGAAGLDANGTDMGSGSVFDDITVVGSGSGGVRLLNTTGTTQLGGGSGTDLSLTTTSGGTAALSVSSGGNVSVPSAGTSSISATGGPAVDVNGTTAISLALDDVSSSNSATNGISLSGLGTGTFSASGGSIGGAAGAAFSVSGGSGAISYPGNLDNGSGQTASITSRTGGAVTLSGPINDTSDAGGGITVSDNTGGSTVFSNAAKTLNTGSGTAVLFNGGDGHTLTFSGGGLNIDATTGTGIDAAGLGIDSPRNTLNITGSGNTIDTAAGRALDVSKTDVGTTPLTFQSIASNGASNGIRLDSTGANDALTVTSTGGGTCTAADSGGCSGGVIQNTTGADDSGSLPTGTGVALRDTRGVSLTRMRIANNANYGLRGSNVSGLTLANSIVNGVNGTSAVTANKDSSAKFDQLTGSVSMTNTEMSGGYTSNLLVSNASGTLNATLANFKSGTIDATGGDDGVQFEGLGTSTNNVTVQNSDFTTATGDLFQYVGNGGGGGALSLTGSHFSNNDPSIGAAGGGVTLSGGARSTTTLNIQDNTFRDSVTAALTIVKSREDGHSGSFGGTVNGNTIGVAGVANSGSSGGSGIAVTHFGSGNQTLNVTNNDVRQYNANGMSFTAGAGLAESGQLNLNVSGNTVAQPGTNPSVTLLNGIRINSGVTPGDSFQTCANVGANSITGSSDAANKDFRVLARQSTTFRLPGYGGAPTDDAAAVAFLQGRIGGGASGTAQSAESGTWIGSGTTCP
jgi:hypothetical protein